MARRLNFAATLLAGAAAFALGGPAQAADFYAGKEIRFLIGLGAGSTYDAYARTLSRHMGRYIPGNPTFINVNMPGAGSLKAYNHIYNVAKKDGTEFGTGHRFVPIMPLFGIKGAKFDGTKFGYVGSANREVGVTIAWHTSEVKTFDDLLKKELIVGTTGAGAALTNFASVLKTALGAKLKVVSGYKTTREIDLALERGEIQGRAGVSYNSIVNATPDWLKENKISFLIQMGLSRHPDLPNVPNILDRVTNATDRAAIELLLTPSEMGRPFVTPPGVPAERLQTLRKAFTAAMKDKAFQADARKQQLELNPMTGAEVEELVRRVYRTASPEVVARAQELTAAGFDATVRKDSGAKGDGKKAKK
ncbi:MAG: Bug family tripartite tricarboxylate transporter substrate binding protein [Alphaproteobacteria bacterium]